MQSPNSHIIPADYLAKFIFGGYAVFTVVSNETGERLTFKIKHGYVKDEKGNRKQKLDRNSPLFVSVLTGGNNQSDYTYLGLINKEKSIFIHGIKSRIGKDAPSVKVITKLIELISKGKSPKNATIYHEGKCGVCGKTLTVPSSILTGIGPVCDTSDARERKIKYLLN